MKKLGFALATVALLWAGNAVAQDNPAYECDNAFGDCGTPEQSGGGCGCGCGSILVALTDLGDTYQFADDFDEDGIEDNSDNCPRVRNDDQLDPDGDGVGSACDNAPNAANPAQEDIDGDGLGDVADDDIDGDAVLNEVDNCKLVPNPLEDGLQLDTDGNGVGDPCDNDIDGDGVLNLEDSCPLNATISVPTPDQLSLCRPDIDGDQIGDFDGDNCPAHYNPSQLDTDLDGLGDDCDDDIDADTILNHLDNCKLLANTEQLDFDKDGLGDAGADNKLCDPELCYVIEGDAKSCFKLESSDLEVYSPSIVAATGDDVTLSLWANRRNQAMRYTWSVIEAPSGSSATIENPRGAVTISTPFQYHYIKDRAPKLVPDQPGTYRVQLSVEAAFEDQQSGIINQTATYTTTITVSGEPLDDSAGCQMSSGTQTGLLGGLLLVAGLGLLVVRRRRD